MKYRICLLSVYLFLLSVSEEAEGTDLLAPSPCWEVEPLPGDLNYDGKVDFGDFLDFVAHFGQAGPVPVRTNGRPSSGKVVPGIEPYRGNLYPHWTQKDCRDTRARVLIAESRVPVTFRTDKQCVVATGEWHCPYTGQIFTDAASLDIDHVIPLKEVHLSGGYKWTPQRRRAYANDEENQHTLVAVYLGANRSKGDRDPAGWIPQPEPPEGIQEKDRYICEYLARWVELKAYWSLTSDQAEQDFIATYKQQYSCP